MGLRGQPHSPAASTPGTHFTGGWVGPRAGMDGAENVVPTGFRSRTVQSVAGPKHAIFPLKIKRQMGRPSLLYHLVVFRVGSY